MASLPAVPPATPHRVMAVALIRAAVTIALFVVAYYLLERATSTSFSQPVSRTDALYFIVTTFSTVGYGDITARSQGARVMVLNGPSQGDERE